MTEFVYAGEYHDRTSFLINEEAIDIKEFGLAFEINSTAKSSEK